MADPRDSIAEKWQDWGGESMTIEQLFERLAERARASGLVGEGWRRDWQNAFLNSRCPGVLKMVIGRPYIIEAPEWVRDGEDMHWLVLHKDHLGVQHVHDVGPCGWYLREYAFLKRVFEGAKARRAS